MMKDNGPIDERKRTYSKPQLTILGSVKEITTGTTSGQAEGGSHSLCSGCP